MHSERIVGGTGTDKARTLSTGFYNCYVSSCTIRSIGPAEKRKVPDMDVRDLVRSVWSGLARDAPCGL